MASEKARLAKDKGNAAFKAADYPTAIGHYTEAILADANDPTFFLNRSAAYLKLGKNEDAERDCTKVLSLNANNVKALFRRGQARRALGNLDDARSDLDKALALEPADPSVRNEILEIEKTLEQQRSKQRQKNVVDPRPIAADTPTTSATATTKRRRVPIEIVEDDSGPSREPQSIAVTPVEALLQPVSSRPLKQESKSVTTDVSPPKPQTFMDAKQAREVSKPIRVSGGIIRHTGNHTIVTRTTSENTPPMRAQTSPSPSSNLAAPTITPTTLFQFTKSWEALQSHPDKWNLIRTVPPSAISGLFQVSLEPELLRSILHTFRGILERDSTAETRDAVRDYLLAFTKVQRFGTVMLFMDKQERQLLDLLRERVNSANP